MARKRRWFVLGLVGTIVGLAVRLVKGRRDGPMEVGRFEPEKKDES